MCDRLLSNPLQEKGWESGKWLQGCCDCVLTTSKCSHKRYSEGNFPKWRLIECRSSNIALDKQGLQNYLNQDSGVSWLNLYPVVILHNFLLDNRKRKLRNPWCVWFVVWIISHLYLLIPYYWILYIHDATSVYFYDAFVPLRCISLFISVEFFF